MDIECNGLRLSYKIVGSGDTKLVLFHGFGQSTNVFNELVGSRPDVTFFLFDVVFHGGSTWQHGEAPVTKKIWKDIMQLFLRKHEIDSVGVLGFSIGARLALSFAECLPENVHTLFLVAPDGISRNPWYSLATSRIGSAVFRYVTRHPDFFRRLTHAVRRLGLVPSSVARFAITQMRSRENAQRVYLTWMSLRKLSWNTAAMKDLLDRYDIGVTVLLAQHDPLIRNDKLIRALNKLPKTTVHVARKSHTALLMYLAEHRLL